MRKFAFLIITLSLLHFFSSCTSSKSGNPSAIKKSFIDLTARYNYYFNANLILTENLKNLALTAKEDYNEILPLYKYGSESEAKAMVPDLDKIIKKASIDIRLHDNSKWTDDCYMLIGKAQYLKRNYEEALKTFIYITSEFDKGIRKNGSKKKKKKKKSKAQREKEANQNEYYEAGATFMKHKPVRWESIIWIIKSYSEMEQFSLAHSIISYARGDKKFPEPLLKDLEIAVAHMYIKQDEYLSAATHLEKALPLVKKKKEKTRIQFILGQLYDRGENNSKAIEKFEAVLDLSPDYEMEFHSKINIANISREQNLLSSKDIVALLESMLKNEKYRQFRGEILFALGEIFLKEGKIDKAIKMFTRSVKSSDENLNQKALGYLKLADIYFDKDDYVDSKAYHDSTLLLLAKEHARYDLINGRRNILQEVVTQINIINMQDSLQQLSKLSDEELRKLLEKKKEEQKDDQQEKQEQPFNLNPDKNNSQVVSSSWPFDNPGYRSTGFSQFKSMWGERPLEDNWRRINKSGFAVTDPDDPDGNKKTDPDNNDNGDKNGIKTHIPVGEDQLAVSNNLIVTAYYKLANIYKDKLRNEPKAAQTFEELMVRFPQNKFRLEVCYNLYLLYKDTSPNKANIYKNIVLKDYPESIFAKVILNPDYIAAAKLKENEINNYYASTYEYFTRNDLQTTLSRKFRADTIYPDNLLKPKFDMLEALTYGKMKKMDTFKLALQQIVNNYPLDEVKVKAIDILNAMEGIEYNISTIDLSKTYLFEPETKHFIIILFKEISQEVNKIQANLSDYNNNYYGLENLKINSVLLDNETQVVIVKDFANSAKSKTYYNDVRYNQQIFTDLNSDDYAVYAISERNYGVFFREKKVADYLKFFSEFYLANE